MRDTSVESVLAGRRVLIAEDGPDNRRVLALLLESVGCEVIAAENGRIALDLLELDPSGFDLVITDIEMPEMGGLEFASAARESGFLVPLIALTARDEESDRMACLRAGCVDHMAKPVDSDHLFEVCARWLDDAADCSEDVVSGPPLVSSVVDDPELAPSVVSFAQSLESRAVELEWLFESGDLHELSQLAHAIMSSSIPLGFPSITEAARAVEQAAAQDEPAGSLGALLETLVGLCLRAALAVSPDVESWEADAA